LYTRSPCEHEQLSTQAEVRRQCQTLRSFEPRLPPEERDIVTFERGAQVFLLKCPCVGAAATSESAHPLQAGQGAGSLAAKSRRKRNLVQSPRYRSRQPSQQLW